MKLITESLLDTEFLVEVDKTTGEKRHYITGIYMQAEKENRNRRVYPLSVLQSAVDKFQPMIKEKRALGEMCHPDSPAINPERVSHLITELRFDGTDVYGKAKVLNTPMGLLTKTLLDEGVKMGVSSRGVGSVVSGKNGSNIVQPDFRLNTVDIVHEPSGIDCWVNGIMEGKEWVYVNGVFTERHIDDARKAISGAKSSLINEVSLKEFQNFLTRIK